MSIVNVSVNEVVQEKNKESAKRLISYYIFLGGGRVVVLFPDFCSHFDPQQTSFFPHPSALARIR